jgi:hypothetical protein
MDGEDLTPLLAGRDVAERPVFTASYAEYVLAGDDDWLLISDSQGEEKRLYGRKDESDEVSDDTEEQVDRL